MRALLPAWASSETSLGLAEDEEEDGGSADAQEKVNGFPSDVVGTVSGPDISLLCRTEELIHRQQLAAMQETLNQLSELNNDAIAESSRTAQRLTEQN